MVGYFSSSTVTNRAQEWRTKMQTASPMLGTWQSPEGDSDV